MLARAVVLDPSVVDPAFELVLTRRRIGEKPADDGELLGYVAPLDDDRWAAQTVFGGVVGIGDTAAEARAIVERDGLASLSWRWFHRRTTSNSANSPPCRRCHATS